MQRIIHHWQTHQQLRYLLIGAWNTAAGYAIFAMLYLLLNSSLNYMAIALLTHLIAVTQSFITQRIFVFRSQGNLLAEYARFHLAHLGSLAIGMSTLPLLVEFFSFSPLIAQGLVTLVLVITSYFVHQHFTFSKSSHD